MKISRWSNGMLPKTIEELRADFASNLIAIRKAIRLAQKRMALDVGVKYRREKQKPRKQKALINQ